MCTTLKFFVSQNGVPVECRLLDWQGMRCASPVCDLMFFIFGCTTKELRDKHYNEFMDVYYESWSVFVLRFVRFNLFSVCNTTLSSFLRRLGSDPTKVFPRNVFEEHLKKFGNFGLAMAVVKLPLFTSDPEDSPDMDALAAKITEAQDASEQMKMDEIPFQSAKTIGAYTKRMMGVFQDMCRLEYI